MLWITLNALDLVLVLALALALAGSGFGSRSDFDSGFGSSGGLPSASSSLFVIWCGGWVD